MAIARNVPSEVDRIMLDGRYLRKTAADVSFRGKEQSAAGSNLNDARSTSGGRLIVIGGHESVSPMASGRVGNPDNVPRTHKTHTRNEIYSSLSPPR